MTDHDGSTFIVHYHNSDEEKNTQTAEEEINTNSEIDKNSESLPESLPELLPGSKIHKNLANHAEDKKMMASFLNGHQCLTGVT